MSKNGDGSDGAVHPFSIGTDPALSAQVRKELVDTLQARGGFDPAKVEHELASRDFREEFVQLLGPLGLAPDTLPDVLAGHLMTMWSVVHDVPLADREVASALSRQFAGLIATNPQVADPVKRQLMGEALLYETVLTLRAQQAAREAGDTAELKQMAESAQKNLLNQRGINLRKLRLTTSGMARA